MSTCLVPSLQYLNLRVSSIDTSTASLDTLCNRPEDVRAVLFTVLLMNTQDLYNVTQSPEASDGAVSYVDATAKVTNA
ncbi:hypothetical protein RvY_17229 [Ramazzottius varieornatus]|uniref:Uncharacterized protein n=1 Tax=Ramazzottius varieornatus TaxID=947166 RepID=A0A1D1W1U1_RAMVA|nr:hypothetical protein RvY_17229 [Ramazzottius varieornatus]